MSKSKLAVLAMGIAGVILLGLLSGRARGTSVPTPLEETSRFVP